MAAIDAAAPEPVEVLIHRAGGAVARAALRLLGGTYGRRVVVVAGKGNNGADGRDAAAPPATRAACACTMLDAADAPAALPRCDLVIDAAYGTGFRGELRTRPTRPTPVLAVDIPSGVDGHTGEAVEGAVRADATVTFAALKPGLLLDDGPERAGAVEVADIGLDVGRASMRLMEDADARGSMPPRRRGDHKWTSGVLVVGGSPGLVGAPWLTANAALHVGAGNVRMAVPGASGWELPPSEVYSRLLPARRLGAGGRSRTAAGAVPSWSGPGSAWPTVPAPSSAACCGAWRRRWWSMPTPSRCWAATWPRSWPVVPGRRCSRRTTASSSASPAPGREPTASVRCGHWRARRVRRAAEGSHHGRRQPGGAGVAGRRRLAGPRDGRYR